MWGFAGGYRAVNKASNLDYALKKVGTTMQHIWKYGGHCSRGSSPMPYIFRKLFSRATLICFAGGVTVS